MKDYLFVNGKRANEVLPNRSLFYGEGLFETFRYKSGLPVLLGQHLERMRLGAELLKIPFQGEESLVPLIQKAIIDSKINDAYVKICLLSEGDSGFYNVSDGTQVHVIIRKYAEPVQSLRLKLNLFRRSSESPLLGVKSTNYLDNILARRDALAQGYDEALFLNEKDQITECSSSNLFWFKDRMLHTPALNCGLLPGTTRGFLLKLITDTQKVQVLEGDFSLKDLNGAEFVFTTNALSGCVPVSQIGNNLYDISHSLFFEIQNMLAKELKWT